MLLCSLFIHEDILTIHSVDYRVSYLVEYLFYVLLVYLPLGIHLYWVYLRLALVLGLFQLPDLYKSQIGYSYILG
ncbi:MAG: hypothetical protein DRJ49_02995 [Thermoprotei archaeon]|nr:MAG: hypothetical protein DRJ49_02995 [Thermoprotei archaeon]